ncbi:MAG: tetratricopeptide repeat protein, partial [Planctomycetes bacterium]|nr:tetratricopeptide repeat protein [Planctomycetota bacterium]
MFRLSLITCTMLLAGMLFAAQGTGKSESLGRERLAQARSLHGKGKFKASLDMYKDILKSNPNKAERLEARKGLVMSQLETGAWTAADASYKGLLRDHKRDEGTGLAIQQIGKVHEAKGQPRKARACYARVISDYSGEPGAVMWAHQSTALIALAEDNLQEANQHVQSILARYKKDKDTPMSLERLAKIYAKLGRKTEARTLFQESLTLARQKKNHSMQAWNHKALALTYIMDNQYDQAQAQVDALIAECAGHTDWALALSYLANDSIHHGHIDQAILICQKALSQYGNDSVTACLWGNLANAYIDSDQADQAQDAIDQLIRKWPQFENMGHCLVDVAHAWQRAGQHAQAYALFRRVRQSFTASEGYASA